MSYLRPGNGNQHRNRQRAIELLLHRGFTHCPHPRRDNLVMDADGNVYWVSAYTSTGGAFVKPPNADQADYLTELEALCDGVCLVRQMADDRLAIYRVTADRWVRAIRDHARRQRNHITWPDVEQLKDQVEVVRASEAPKTTTT